MRPQPLFFLIASMLSMAVCNSVSAKIGAVDVVVGLPQLIGAELQGYLSEKKFHIGAGFGFFPINSILQSKVRLPTIDMGSGFALVPSAEYSLTSISAFARYFPGTRSGAGAGGFFLQLHYAYWNASADATSVISFQGIDFMRNALSGTISMNQHLTGLMAGYQVPLGSDTFIDLAGGLAFLFPVQTKTEFSQTSDFIASLLPQRIQDEFNSTKRTLQNEVDSKVKEFWGKYRVLPQVFLSVGVRF